MVNCGSTEYGYDKRCHMKGASECVLDSCAFYMNQDGQKLELNDEMKSHLESVINEYASQALRTITFAYKDLKRGEGGPTHEEMDSDNILHAIEESGYTLICIAGIKDIIRKEVPDAIAECQAAGIIVRMVTGDNVATAKAIAKECGIISDDLDMSTDVVLEGKEFYDKVEGLFCKTCKKDIPVFCKCDKTKQIEGIKNLNMFRALKKNLRVLARSRPEDKYLLVAGLKELLEVVAVTGDGTNDAPALKKADVGFAMGISGTDVAKNSADIIIMDDNFASIVKACMWGRNIYENIRRFLQF